MEPATQSYLINEYNTYQLLAGYEGFPSILHFGKDSHFTYLVMELVGQNLQEYFKNFNKVITLTMIKMYAHQMLKLIEALHSKGIVHRDIKPSNFCINKSNSSLLFMIDYGLSCAYNTQLMESEGVSTKSLIGTPLFASKNAHLGLALTRADDLESLGYSLIYLSCGMLPWTHISVSDKEAKCHIIGKIKNELTVADLCKDMDDCFLRYFEYVFALATNQTPDYSYLDSIFAIKKMGSNSDSKLQSISLDEEMENDERSIAAYHT